MFWEWLWCSFRQCVKNAERGPKLSAAFSVSRTLATQSIRKLQTNSQTQRKIGDTSKALDLKSCTAQRATCLSHWCPRSCCSRAGEAPPALPPAPRLTGAERPQDNLSSYYQMKLWAQHKKLLSIHARIISINNTVEIASNITKYVRAMTFLAQISEKMLWAQWCTENQDQV